MKKFEVRGTENFVREGPSIIVGNHVGSFKDVSLLFKIVPRQIFFTANQMIFKKEDFSFIVRKHLYRHLKNFGLFIHLILNPLYAYIVDYISSNIAKIGTIPVNLDGGRAAALQKCQAYLRAGRAVIALQGRGHIDSKSSNPYVIPFRHGASAMAYNLYNEDNISVPVTPMSIFGTHKLIWIPGRIKVSVGTPMYIRDYWMNGASETIEHFRNALETRVKRLLMESLKG